MEAESRGLDGRRIGRVAPGAEALGAFEKVNGDFGIGVAEGGSAGLDQLSRALMDPGKAFLAIAGAEVGEEFAETAFEGFLDTHGSVEFHTKAQRHKEEARVTKICLRKRTGR